MVQGVSVRDRNKERVWRKIVRGRRDGESIRAYCRARGVKEAAFYWWRRELARRDAPKSATAFVPVMLDAASGHAEGITIELRGGRVLRLPVSLPAARIAELVGAVEGAS